MPHLRLYSRVRRSLGRSGRAMIQGEDPISGAVTGRRLAGTVDDQEVSLQAKPVAPASFLAPADQIGGAVEAIAHEPDRRPGREPRYDSLQKCLLHVEPD